MKRHERGNNNEAHMPTRLGNAVIAMLLDALIASAGPLDTWSSRNSGTNVYLLGSTYADGKFVVVGQHGVILTSTDGVNWTNRASTTSEWLYDVAYGNGIFVATGSSFTDHSLTNALVTSPDGVTWTARAVPSVGGIYSVTYGAGRFVAIGYTEKYAQPVSTVLVSSDGLSWTNAGSITNVYLPDITYGAGKFVAVGDDYGPFPTRAGIFTSEDGISWSQQVVPYGRMETVTYGNGLFVVMGQAGTILTSSDTITWMNRSSGTDTFFRTSAYANGTFVGLASGNSGGGTYDESTIIRKSTDGIVWTGVDFEISNTCPTLSFGADTFVAAGFRGIIFQSGFFGSLLRGAGHPTAAGFQITIKGEVGRSYRLQGSTNLSGTNWSDVRSFSLLQESTNVLDGAATNIGQRFYRVVSP